MPKDSGIPFAIGESTIDLHKFSLAAGVCVTLSLADGDIGIAVNLLFPSKIVAFLLELLAIPSLPTSTAVGDMDIAVVTVLTSPAAITFARAMLTMGSELSNGWLTVGETTKAVLELFPSSATLCTGSFKSFATSASASLKMESSVLVRILASLGDFLEGVVPNTLQRFLLEYDFPSDEGLDKLASPEIPPTSPCFADEVKVASLDATLTSLADPSDCFPVLKKKKEETYQGTKKTLYP
jgi:hypothetical protein